MAAEARIAFAWSRENAGFATSNPNIRSSTMRWARPVCLAQKIEIRNCKERIQELLRLPADSWLILRHAPPELGTALLFRAGETRPNIVPIRASFDGNSVNIATTYVSSPYPTWYALPDIVASRLFDETRPIEILDAFELIPIGEVRA